MSLKEFKCPACGNIFEKFTGINTVKESCPKCGNEGCSLNFTGKCNSAPKGGCSGKCGGCNCCKH